MSWINNDYSKTNRELDAMGAYLNSGATVTPEMRNSIRNTVSAAEQVADSDCMPNAMVGGLNILKPGAAEVREKARNILGKLDE